jgi:hypothetical protein
MCDGSNGGHARRITRRFTLWIAVLSSAATIVAAAVAVIFSAAHVH